MQIAESARKHGMSDADILHAWRNAISIGEFEHDGEVRVFAIGPGWDGRLLELVAVPAEQPERIIHADNLRESFRNRF